MCTELGAYELLFESLAPPFCHALLPCVCRFDSLKALSSEIMMVYIQMAR